MNYIVKQVENPILKLTLNRPEKLNCVHLDLLYELDIAIGEAGEDPEIKVVIISGAGNRAFSTGGDLKAFRNLTDPEVIKWIRTGNGVFNRLESLHKPTVAVVHGFCLGGGLELALACDFRIATTKASFGSPELSNGWLPGWGGMARLRRLIGEAHTKEIILLSETITANEAYQYGLVTQVVSEEALLDTVADLTDKLCKIESNIFAMAKSVIQNPKSGTSESEINFDILCTYYAKNIAEEDSSE